MSLFTRKLFDVQHSSTNFYRLTMTDNHLRYPGHMSNFWRAGPFWEKPSCWIETADGSERASLHS